MNKLLDGNWRNVVDRGLSPIGRNLHRAGITADVVTIIGILMAVAASISVASVSYTHLTLPTKRIV